jgi:hypothetical protein
MGFDINYLSMTLYPIPILDVRRVGVETGSSRSMLTGKTESNDEKKIQIYLQARLIARHNVRYVIVWVTRRGREREERKSKSRHLTRSKGRTKSIGKK